MGGNIKQLLLSNNYWVLNKDIVRLYGADTALILTVFAEADEMMADEDGWFYQTADTVEELTGLTRYKQDLSIKVLEKMGVLHKDVRGVPARRFFKLDYEILANQFAKLLKTRLRKTSKLDSKTFERNKEHIDKEHINKEHTDKEHKEAAPVPYQKIKDLYNNICKSYPRIRVVSENRKKSLRARFKQYDNDLEIFKELFTIAESSAFLKGNNKRGWKANFDWLINEANMAKALEGRYSDEPRADRGDNTDTGNDQYGNIGLDITDL